jgi:hypothetical protein
VAEAVEGVVVVAGLPAEAVDGEADVAGGVVGDALAVPQGVGDGREPAEIVVAEPGVMLERIDDGDEVVGDVVLQRGGAFVGGGLGLRSPSFLLRSHQAS